MLVSRMFTTNEDAMGAVANLEQVGFRQASIRVIDKTKADVSETGIMQQGLSEAHAKDYAEGIRQGGTLVIAEAPLGASGRAAEILERVRPNDQDTPHAAYEDVTRPKAEPSTSGSMGVGGTPLSTALNWPVLLDNPAPLSSYLNRRTLSKEQTPRASLLHNPTPLSSRLGMKVLSDKATPLSSLLGRKVLLDNPTPLSSRLNREVLLDNPTPLSSRLNMKVLLDNPTPLSSWLGLKVLANTSALFFLKRTNPKSADDGANRP
ncbi:hypothetical protein [Rhodopila sp.]|uniref:hypothetical protein n=1 Tax=Rhodopila sp. TaxID=2480087 RepID=UPI003D0F31A7